MFHIHTKDECRNSLCKIADCILVDQGKVRMFIQALEEAGHDGYLDPTYPPGVHISLEENADAIAKALKRFVETLPNYLGINPICIKTRG